MSRTSRFADDEGFILTTPQCHGCKHWRGDLTCAAFPDGVLIGILANELDHREAIEGDHGIRFEPKDNASPEAS